MLPAWAFVAAAISLWASLKGITTVNVSENDVGVLFTLWSLWTSQGLLDTKLDFPHYHGQLNKWISRQMPNTFH
jgi:hypothetical protein